MSKRMPKPLMYVLDQHGNPVVEDDMEKWADWYERHDRIVAQTTLRNDSTVSTVYLGIDHDFTGEGPPVLWETMVFGGPRNGMEKRYTSRKDAEAGHTVVVERLKRELALRE